MLTKSTRRSFLGAVPATPLLGLPELGRAQGSPEPGKQIQGLSPFAIGSTADTLARAYAQAMTEALGTTVFIDDRPGAEGVLALQAAKAAGAGGYTILFTTLSTQVVNPHLFKKLPYDPLSDFIPLAGTMRTGLCMAVSPSLPFKSAKEFVEAASRYVQDCYGRFGMEALDLGGNDLAAFQRTEYEKWGKAVRDAGLTGTL